MATTTQPMTAQELLNMPDDGFRYELVRGELRKMPPAGHVHGEYAMFIGSSLVAHVKANGLGKVYAAETGFQLESDHVRAPDAAFVRRERAEAVRGTLGVLPRTARRCRRGHLPNRPLHGSRGEGRRLARRWRPCGHSHRPAPANRKGASLPHRHRPPGGSRRPPSRRRHPRLANPHQRHLRVGCREQAK